MTSSSFLHSLDQQLRNLGADKALSLNHSTASSDSPGRNVSLSRSQELMRGLEHKADALLRELAAIHIQRRTRGFLVRRRLAYFFLQREWEIQMSTVISLQLMDEVCVELAARSCFDVMSDMGMGLGVGAFSGALMFHQDSIISISCTDIINDVLVEMVKKVVIETIKECTQAYLRSKPNFSSNPIVALIMTLCFEVSDEVCKHVAKESVKELTDEYLTGLQAIAIFNHVASSHTKDVAKTLVPEALNECEEEWYLDFIVNEVVGSLALGVSLEILDTVKREWEEALKREDERQITLCFQRTAGRRLAVAHLMLSVSDGFENVLLEYQARSIVKRMIAQRLAHILNEAQQIRQNFKDSLFLCDVASKALGPPLQKVLVERHWELFQDKLELIDKMEQEFQLQKSRQSNKDGEMETVTETETKAETELETVEQNGDKITVSENV